MDKFGFSEILILVIMSMIFILGLTGAIMTGRGDALGLAGAGILISGFFYAMCKATP